MPVVALPKTIDFSLVQDADSDGLVAIGGDLSEKRLIWAYRNGIFPWPYSETAPLLWFNPDPRTLLVPDKIHVSRSLKKSLRNAPWSVTFDTDFAAVIHHCADVARPDQSGTWITPSIIRAYCRMHELGYAHSVEVWREQQFAGGLYGISLGAAFFGESMFSTYSNASKIALVALARQLTQWKFLFIDCQIHTSHLESLGAQRYARSSFLQQLKKALQFRTIKGPWTHLVSVDLRGS